MPTTASIFDALPHPPTITTTTSGHTRVTLTLPVTRAATHMTGHYPGFPILPGVLLIDTIRQTTSAALNTELHLHTIHRARFTRPLLPGDELHLTLTIHPTTPPTQQDNTQNNTHDSRQDKQTIRQDTGNPDQNKNTTDGTAPDPTSTTTTSTTGGADGTDGTAGTPTNHRPTAGQDGNQDAGTVGGRPTAGQDHDGRDESTTANPAPDPTSTTSTTGGTDGTGGTGGTPTNHRPTAGQDDGPPVTGPVGGRITVTAHGARADGLPAAQLTLTLAPAVTHA